MNTELLFNSFLSHALDPVFIPPSYFPNSVVVQTFILHQLGICSSLCPPASKLLATGLSLHHTVTRIFRISS